MSVLVNTIDELGDEATMDGLLSGSLTHFHDDTIHTIAQQNGYMSALTVADFGNLQSLQQYAFWEGSPKHLVIRNRQSICTIPSWNVLYNSAIANGAGFVYVPRAMADGSDGVEAYKAATNWSAYADQFRAIEDYTVDGTITGELDESKI